MSERRATDRPVRPPAQPGFFWQGLLMLLPVGILVGIGLLSLRQDRLLAEREAEERARELAAELVSRLVRAFDPAITADSPTNASHWASRFGASAWFELNPRGELVTPGELNQVPTPRPLDLSSLSDPQRALWLEAQTSEFSGAFSNSAAAYNEFLQSGAPAGFLPHARYALGLLQLRLGHTNLALESFTQTLHLAGSEPGETGLPLSHLAGLRLLELATDPQGTWNDGLTLHLPALRGALFSAIQDPSPITPRLLAAADRFGLPPIDPNASGKSPTVPQATWPDLWLQAELARDLHRRARGVPPSRPGATHPAMSLNSAWDWRPWLWVEDLADTDWFGLRISPTNAPGLYLWWNNPRIHEKVAQAVQGLTESGIFSLQIQIGGHPLLPAALSTRVSGQPTRPLSTASGPAPAFDYLSVQVHLRDPTLFFQKVRSRRILFVSLIGASAAAALIGFMAAWRAFARQQRLAELKTNFVSSVSHELRAPIASVRLMAEGLERGLFPDPPRQREYFRFIVQECRRLSSLIENVLDFSRIEQRRKRYDFEPTDVAALVRETVRLMQTYAAAKQVRLELAIPPETASRSVEWWLDGRAIQQALVNLLDNAIKHSPQKASIDVGFAVEGSLLRIYVADQGPGIPPEEHERIFERFYRCGSELRRETQGVGIGLSIVKHIVEAHHGRVRLQSAPAQGSRFTIELPAQPSHHPTT